MARRKRIKSAKSGVLRKIRKPLAPPARVHEDSKKFSRVREAERLRRIAKQEQEEQPSILEQTGAVKTDPADGR